MAARSAFLQPRVPRRPLTEALRRGHDFQSLDGVVAVAKRVPLRFVRLRISLHVGGAAAEHVSAGDGGRPFELEPAPRMWQGWTDEPGAVMLVADLHLDAANAVGAPRQARDPDEDAGADALLHADEHRFDPQARDGLPGRVGVFPRLELALEGAFHGFDSRQPLHAGHP